MSADRRAALLLVLALVGLAPVSGCGAPERGEVLFSVDGFAQNELRGLFAPQALLSVTTAGDGRPATVRVTGPNLDEARDVTPPVPVPCDADGRCSLSFSLPRGDYALELALSAEDRCGQRGELLVLAGTASVAPYQSTVAALEPVDASFDDDGDGVVNLFELQSCGRVGVAEGAQAPRACLAGREQCCQGRSALEGAMTTIAGGPHTRADASSTTVAAFALDATEATWAMLSRCVAAGSCLAGRPDHPARLALADEDLDPRLPVTGLLPVEADELCAFFGKRLPTDDEWDFAAAHRTALPAGERARFPFDLPPGDDVACQPDAGGVAVNYRRAGDACPQAPLPVASFPTSTLAQGDGALADLAGNVAEWTVTFGDAPAVPEVPSGVRQVSLRGGGATSPLLLLENDLPVEAPFPSSGDALSWQATVSRLARSAGVRCAADSAAPIVDDTCE